jgi:hypothetical protein
VTKRCDKTGEVDVLPTYFRYRSDEKSSNVYVWMTAPRDVARFLPSELRVVRISMGTRNAKAAVLRGMPLVQSTLAAWDKVRKQLREPQGPKVVPGYLTGDPAAPDEITLVKTALTPQLIQNLVAARMHAWVRLDDRERPELSDDEFDDAVKFSAMSVPQLRQFIGRGAQKDKNPELIEQILDTGEVLGIQIDSQDPLFGELVREFAIGEVKIHEFVNKRNQGDWPDTKEILRKTGTHLSEMIEPYRKHKTKHVGAHYLSTGLSVWNDLIEHKGDVFLSEVSQADIYALMEHHLHVTKRWGQKYLSTVHTYLDDIFALAITLNKFEGPSPLEKLTRKPQLTKEEREAREKPRFALSSKHINAILASEWYNPNATHWRGQLREDLGCRYFMPIISFLHGPRVREPLQLMTDEVIERDGIACFHFRIEFEDADESKSKVESSMENVVDTHVDWPSRSLKNSAVSRIIPIHPKLLELGFMDYVQERRKQLGRPGPLFPSALPAAGGNSPKYGRAYEQAMLRFMKDKLKFAAGYGNHGHRHQFEDRIRAANAITPWPAGMWQFLGGRSMVRKQDQAHAAKVGSEKHYGNGYSPAHVLTWQASLDFSDIEFPPPYLVWKSSGR